MVSEVDNAGEVCFEEEVEKLRRSGMSAPEIARQMGVDQGWVESLISMSADEEAPAEQEKGPPGDSGGP